MREKKSKISVVAHNLFRFDFYFLLKGLRTGVWKEPDKYKFCKYGNQVMFLDTIKYFQQSLGTLASKLTKSEKLTIRTECKKFLNKDENLSKKFNALAEKDQE